MSAKMSSKTAKKRMGFYDSKETIEEVKHSLKTMSQTDEVLTLVAASGTFMVLDMKELLFQMKLWKSLGCEALECNIKEKEVDGKKVWMYVIQPPDLEKAPTFCPLAAGLGMLVSGYTYIARNKSTADLVVRYLSKSTA